MNRFANIVRAGSGGGGEEPWPDSVAIGEIYNQSSWANLNDFTVNGGTFAVNGSFIRMSGGSGTFTQSLGLSTGSHAQTCLERWKITANIRIISTPTTTTFGFGLGVRSSNTGSAINAVARFVSTSSGTNTKKALIHAGPSNTLAATSAGTMASVAAGDLIELIVELSVGQITISARNITQAESAITASYTYITDGSGLAMGNTGRFSIFSFGGTNDVESLLIESTDLKNARYCFVGDSKTRAYRTSNILNSFSHLFRTNQNQYTTINAGGADRITEALLRINEIILLNPQVCFLAIGSNDTREGDSNATVTAAYDSLVSQIVAAGIRVIHLGPIREDSAGSGEDLEFFYTHLNSTYSAANIIDPGSPTLDADDIHPNDTGQGEIYVPIVNNL